MKKLYKKKMPTIGPKWRRMFNNMEIGKLIKYHVNI